MKTIDEMIAVMQAYKEGKKIEYKLSEPLGEDWFDDNSPDWNWYALDYRVKPEKPEPQYVPYDSVLEVERDKWVRSNTSKGFLRRISSLDLRQNQVYVEGYGWCGMKDLFEKLKYEDGTPCGKLKGEKMMAEQTRIITIELTLTDKIENFESAEREANFFQELFQYNDDVHVTVKDFILNEED